MDSPLKSDYAEQGQSREHPALPLPPECYGMPGPLKKGFGVIMRDFPLARLCGLHPFISG